MRTFNMVKTALLRVLISGLFLAIGYLIGGQSGMSFAFIMSLAMNFGAYWFSDKIVLAMHKVQAIKPQDPSGVYEIVEELCRLAKLPMPKVYRIPEWTPNAFATGRNPKNAAVAVTDGILKILDKRELRGVLAHEISHIQNRDILVSTIVAAFAHLYIVNHFSGKSVFSWFSTHPPVQERVKRLRSMGKK